MSSRAQIALSPRNHASRLSRAPQTRAFAPQYAPSKQSKASVSWSRRSRALIWIAAAILSWVAFIAMVQGIRSLLF